ncbi:MAG: GNAT family N-acetyltransferase [Bacteroidetes bacterium]|nr:GNAT family N-acetyltransferase [Bacteroidota bacterium]
MKYLIRLIEEEDADFIITLRNNPKLNRHLNFTSSKVEDQIKWIKEYKLKEKNKEEFYFTILENGFKKGLYRLYKINKVSFTIGSWIFDTCDNKNLPIMVDLIMADLGFYGLHKNILLFDIRKDNKKVIHYHSLKSPLQYFEDHLNNYYLIKSDNWEISKKNVVSFFNINMADYEILKTTFKF